jgi:hypothetical protein
VRARSPTVVERPNLRRDGAILFPAALWTSTIARRAVVEMSDGKTAKEVTHECKAEAVRLADEDA